MIISDALKPEFASSPLIRSLDDAAIDELARVSHFQRFPPSTILFREGDLPSLLFIVSDGLVVARRQNGGLSTTISASSSGAVFPLGSIISDWPCLLTVEVVVSSQIFMVPAANVRTLAETHLAFASAVGLELAAGYRHLIGQVATQKLLPSAGRLAVWLLANAGEDGYIDLQFSKIELASLLGMSPESLSRSLQALSREGLEVSKGAMRVTDRSALAQYLGQSSSGAAA